METPQTPLGEREHDVMRALWRLDAPATVSEVHEVLVGEGHDLAYTTVQTLLNRLEAKGKVGRERDGRAHRYRARISESTVAKDAVSRLVDRFFGGSAEALATHLVGDLRDDEIERVRALIDAAAKEDEP